MTTSFAWMGAVQLTALPNDPETLDRVEVTPVFSALERADLLSISEIYFFTRAYGGRWY